KLIHDDLLFKYDDITELMHHVMESSEKVGRNEEWRVKIRSVLPHDGIVMKHIKTGEDVCLSRRVVAVFLLMTIADFSDQLFGFQDVLFENTNGMLKFEGNEVKNALWPGDGKPGLWMSSLSRMGAIYRLIVREEELYLIERGQGRVEGVSDRDEDTELVIPQIFDNCTKVLSAEDQIKARDLYWEGVCGAEKRGLDGCEEVLRKSVEKNPFVGEPHVVLGQIYLSQGRFEEAEKESEEGLCLLLEWGSPWDKRMSWEGWIAWCRVLVMKAKEKSWPETSWGVLPADGIVLKHIKTGEDVHLSRKIVATFLLITMADFSDQFFCFQDVLFSNSDGMMQFSGSDYATELWPGDGKPGLWMNSISRMGAIYTLIMREEQM
ncbi:tetratricopeptide-like helical domain containing protein, partial [Tanacetum coccineum]